MRLSLILLSCLLVESLSAQVAFHNSYQGLGAEKGYSVEVTSDGYMLAGSSNTSGTGQNDVLVIKTDPNGAVVWQKNYGGPGDDVGMRIRQVNDGNFVIAGSTKSFPSGDMNFYVIKIDSAGTVLWSKVFGGPMQDSVTSFIETSDFGLLIIGCTNSIGAGNLDVYMLKLDAGGVYQWSKAAGNSGNDVTTSVLEIPGSGFLFTGYTDGFGFNGNNPLMLFTNDIGDVQWAKTYELGSFWNNPKNCRFNDLVSGYQGDYVIVGQSCCDNIGAGRSLAMSIDILGNINWMKDWLFNSGASGTRSVIRSADGQFLLGGYYSGGSFSSGWGHIFKLNVLGNLQWTQYYNTASSGFEIKLVPNGQFVLTGHTQLSGDYKLYLLKPEYDGTINCQSAPTVFWNPVNITPVITTRTYTTTTTNYALTDSCNVTNSSVAFTQLCLYTGIENATGYNETISISPNPATEFIIVSDQDWQKEGSLEIYNVQGQLIYKNEHFQNQVEINVVTFPKGAYIIKVIRNDHLTFHKFLRI